jgi:hypothetical protein
VLVAIKSEVSFELDGNTSPRNYGCVWYWWMILIHYLICNTICKTLLRFFLF